VGDDSDLPKLPGERAAAPRPSAFAAASRLLARRAYLSSELAARLTAKEYADDEIADALARLRTMGALDDLAVARREAERLQGRERRGRRAVVARLVRLGADDALIDAALRADPVADPGADAGSGSGSTADGFDDRDPDAELERARELARRWLATHRPDSGPAGAAALARHLDRKGHERRVIFRVLNELNLDAPAEE
jgi:regulatory protein